MDDEYFAAIMARKFRLKGLAREVSPSWDDQLSGRFGDGHPAVLIEKDIHHGRC